MLPRPLTKVYGVSPTRPFPPPPKGSDDGWARIYIAFCAVCGRHHHREMTEPEYAEWSQNSRMCTDCEYKAKHLKDGNGRPLFSDEAVRMGAARYAFAIPTLVEQRKREAPPPSRPFPANEIVGGERMFLVWLFAVIVGVPLGLIALRAFIE